MRGDVVYRIYGVHEGREKDYFFGAFRTVAEAEAEIAKLRVREMDGRNWAEQYHDRGFVIRETVVQTDFEVPPRPKPRDRYFVRGTRKEYGPETMAGTVVEVFRRADAGGEPEKVGEYERNYGLLHTFEPFRQGGREFALISPQYTGTSVLDLATGRVIAEGTVSPTEFCPVGFYVPDWSTGKFGFVWGCVWGDDGSWKVQYLDLTGIRDGVVRRDERFGYVELATAGYRSPCFDPEAVAPPRGSGPPPFIRVWQWEGKVGATFAVAMRFDLASGQPEEWQRLRIADFE